MTLATTALNCAKLLKVASADGTSILKFGDEIKAEIANAIREYNRKPWALTEVRGLELTTVANTTWYSTVDVSAGTGEQAVSGRTAVSVSDILHIDYIRQTDPLDYELARLPYKEFEALFEGSVTGGRPTYFTVYAGQIGLWNTPDTAQTMYISAKVKPVVPTADSDTSIWFDRANELIEQAACKRVAANHRNNMEDAAKFGAMEVQQAAVFHEEHIRQTKTGKVRVHN